MLSSLNKKYHFNDNLKINVRIIIGISLGVFLFLLFFQPLNPQNPDFNKQLIILAGFGGITLVLMTLFRVIIPSIFPKLYVAKNWNLKKELIIDLLFLITNSVAFVFYARYVGKIDITFFKTILIVIISTVSIVILVFVNDYHYLLEQVQFFNSQNAEKEDAVQSSRVKIVFESENKSEFFQLYIQQLILIKASNNYIEVYYLDEEKVHKKLIRNTLKNTEQLFRKYKAIVRCHRSCMVNTAFVKKAEKGSDGLFLTLSHYPNQIHVSRQYVLKVKEALKNNL